MIEFNNMDNSFFEIIQGKTKEKSDNEGLKIANENIISLSLTEEMYKIMTGSIQFNDSYWAIAHNLQLGFPVEIKWGYTVPDLGIKYLLTNNIDEVQMVWQREGIRGIIQSPSGTISGGNSIYNCNFYATYSLGIDNFVIYRKGVKSDVVKSVFANMGIKPENMEVDFKRGDEVITSDTQIVQKGHDFYFLNKISREWQAIFSISFTNEGELYGLFIDNVKLNKSKFVKKVTGAVAGNTIYFNFKETVSTKDTSPNIISASWKNNAGDSGYGDSTRLTYVNGQPVFTRFVANKQVVETWELRPEIIEKELESKKNFMDMAEVTKQWMAKKKFEQVKKFFKLKTQTTAPQGLGYSVTIEMPGLPQVTSPMRAKFGAGFPSFLSQSNIAFYVNKVTHKIDATGYKMSVECCDHFTSFGGSLI